MDGMPNFDAAKEAAAGETPKPGKSTKSSGPLPQLLDAAALWPRSPTRTI